MDNPVYLTARNSLHHDIIDYLSRSSADPVATPCRIIYHLEVLAGAGDSAGWLSRVTELLAACSAADSAVQSAPGSLGLEARGSARRTVRPSRARAGTAQDEAEADVAAVQAQLDLAADLIAADGLQHD